MYLNHDSTEEVSKTSEMQKGEVIKLTRTHNVKVGKYTLWALKKSVGED